MKLISQRPSWMPLRIGPVLFLMLVLVAAAMPGLGSAVVVTGDFNNDGNEDMLVIRNGAYFIRPNVAVADSPVIEMTFATPPPFLIPSTAKTGDINGDGIMDVVVGTGSGGWLLVIYGQSSLTAPFQSDEFPLPGGAGGADAAQFTGDERLEIVAIANALPPPLPNVSMLNTDGDMIAEYPLPAEAGRWVSLDVAAASLLQADPLPQFGWLFADEEDNVGLWWMEFEPAAPGSLEPPTTKRVHQHRFIGAFIEEATFPTLDAGFPHGGTRDGHWIVLPANSETVAIVPADVPTSQDPVAHIEPLGFPAAGGSLVRDPDGDLILAIAIDGTFAALFRWHGPGNLERVETIEPPAGYALSDLVPLSDGDLFALLREHGAAPGDWGHVGHYDRQDEVKRWNFVQGWPAKRKAPSFARVVVFDRDPFVSGFGLEWESFSVGDWALNATIEGDEIVVELQEDAGAPDGLGLPTVTRLQPRRALPPTAVALANQWEPDSSLFFAGPPLLHGGAAVSPQPGPGSYGAPVEVTFVVEGNVDVRFRVGRGDWQQGRGPALISQTTTLEFYGATPDGHASPIQSARYAIGEPQGPLPGNLRQDLDGNGLDDAWERLYFGDLTGVDPDVDHDGDGFTTGQEYDAGTNPLDPNSRPTGVPPSSLRIIAQLNPTGRISLRLDQDFGATIVVELSADLETWFTAPNPPEYNPDGSVDWEELEPAPDFRFFRVRFEFE